MLIITVKSILIYRTFKVLNLQSKGHNFNRFLYNQHILIEKQVIYSLKYGISHQAHNHTYNRSYNEGIKAYEVFEKVGLLHTH